VTGILVHVTCGPAHPTKAALAFLVAKAAVEEGHEVEGKPVELTLPTRVGQLALEADRVLAY